MTHDETIKYAVACAIIFAFLFQVIAVAFVEIPADSREIFAHMMGMVDGSFVGGLVAYYYTKSNKNINGGKHE